MVACPACAHSPLVEFDVEGGANAELCGRCKGMLLDGPVLVQLAGGSDVDALLATLGEPRAEPVHLGSCLRCNTQNWQGHARRGQPRAGVSLCGTCGMAWLEAGELEPLRAGLLAEKRKLRALSLVPAADTAADAVFEAPELDLDASIPSNDISSSAPSSGAPSVRSLSEAAPFDRVSFDEGLANRLGAPVMLLVGLLVCASPGGRFLASLVGMPFHEVGHALTSWLSSRFAVPLPFFTVWHEEQSVLFGVLVALVLAAFGLRSWHERSRFGTALASALLLLQLGMSWLVPSHLTLMLQILGGALGEIVLGALVLVAFHHPLPDRLRWDFWRWPALLPGALCFANAFLLWSRAASDPTQIPWGSAIGDESDGDMNRLVRDFGWTARGLAAFYLKASWVALLALAATQGLAWRRGRARSVAVAPGPAAPHENAR